jgi:hypothetical protein
MDATASPEAMLGVLALVFGVVFILMVVPTIVGSWKTFEKAGQPGWASLVPIYNIVVMLQIIKRPMWWIVLLFIPLANFVIFLILFEFCKAFGKGAGTFLLLVLLQPIGWLYLGFGDAKFQG